MNTDNQGIEAPEGWGNRIICPVCNGRYTHFTSPVYSNVEGKSWEGRGNAIKINFSCENEHFWTLRIGHHKGHSYISEIGIKENPNYKFEKEQTEKEVEAIAFYKQGFDAGRNKEQFDYRKPLKMVEKLNELKGICKFCGFETREQDFDGSKLDFCSYCNAKYLNQESVF